VKKNGGRERLKIHDVVLEGIDLALRRRGYARIKSDRASRCQCCGESTVILHLDHCHETGVFRGWVCNGCNTGAGIMDNVERLEKRIVFLKAHDEKMRRIALIKEVQERLT
jgi:hypothetical protein